MLSKTRYSLAVLALAAVPFVTQSQPMESKAEVDCSDGWPRMGCRIWEVKMVLGVPAQYSCETGGKWKCGSKLLDF